MAKALGKKLLIISLDALSDTEFDRLKRLKNFSRFIENGAYSKGSISVYPTQTYTVHASVITGCYPDVHGVYSNQFFQPFVPRKQKKWFWYRNQIKADTLYDAAAREGKKVCSILWPVSGGANIKYNIPEIVAINNENQAVKILKNGSFFFTLFSELRHGRHRQGVRQPMLDEFAVMCAKDAAKRHSPDMLMIHLVSIDAAKHNYGIKSTMVDDALKNLDDMIGQLMDAYKDYSIIMFSDHGQIDVEHDVYINQFLANNGMLDFEKETYDAYIECGDGCGIVRAKDEEFMQKALKLIEGSKDMLGIEEIYNKDKVEEMRVGCGIEHMLEMRAGYSLKDGESHKILRSLKEEGRVHATHGYSPYKQNYKCLFFAMGEGIKKGMEIEHMNVVDIAPTAARILGIDKFLCDGTIIEEIFG
ncbi:MAG: alkaline phosphatase family protein [Eubacteriales bacterium]